MGKSKPGFWTRVALWALLSQLGLVHEDGAAQSIVLHGHQSWTSEADFSSPVGLGLTVELNVGLTFHAAWATDDHLRIGVPCGGFVVPGSGCSEQPVTIDGQMGMFLIGWKIPIDLLSWGELHVTPEVGVMALESTWTGLESDNQVRPDGGHWMLGARSGLRVFPFAGIPVGLEAGVVLRRSWDLMNEQCLDCHRGYSEAIHHAGLTVGILIPSRDATP